MIAAQGGPSGGEPPDSRALAKELRDRADRLWDRRNFLRRGSIRSAEAMLGELVAGAGEIITVTRLTRRHRAVLRFRYWRIRPDGTRMPMTFGMNISTTLLPRLGSIIAHAPELELAATDEQASGPEVVQGGSSPSNEHAADELPAWAGGR